MAEKDLRLITVPEQYENFRVVNYGFAGSWIMETDSKSLNSWKMFLGNEGNYEILGFTKDIIVGEQIKGVNFLLRIR